MCFEDDKKVVDFCIVCFIFLLVIIFLEIEYGYLILRIFVWFFLGMDLLCI